VLHFNLERAIPYSKEGLEYIANFSLQIKEYSASLGVSALGIAAAILREYTAAETIYPKKIGAIFSYCDSYRASKLRARPEEA
jgi:hypothetical protein